MSSLERFAFFIVFFWVSLSIVDPNLSHQTKIIQTTAAVLVASYWCDLHKVLFSYLKKRLLPKM